MDTSSHSSPLDNDRFNVLPSAAGPPCSLKLPETTPGQPGAFRNVDSTRCILDSVRYMTGVLALLLATACTPVPRPEQTIVDGREVFLIQEAPCLFDCIASFYINRIQYMPTCGRLPRSLREEFSRGTLFAVADPDVYAWRLPERRATVVPGVEPRWLVGVRMVGACGGHSHWSLASPLGPQTETVVCNSRPDIGRALDFSCE
jgi:hypothetical protein